MAYSKGYDKPLLTVGTHEVLYDKYQIVLKHPTTCPGRGAGLDKRKTFHPWSQAILKLSICGETPTPAQIEAIKQQGMVCEKVAR